VRSRGLGGLPSLSREWESEPSVAIIIRERQRTRLIRTALFRGKRVTGLLQFLGETKRHGRVFVEDDPAALVILNEGVAELADSRCRQPFGCAA